MFDIMPGVKGDNIKMKRSSVDGVYYESIPHFVGKLSFVY